MRWKAVGEVPLTQDRDQRRAVVNTVMNLQIPKYPGHNTAGKRCLAVAKSLVWEAIKLEPQCGIRDFGGQDGTGVREKQLLRNVQQTATAGMCEPTLSH
jgi:hypothetical protein